MASTLQLDASALAPILEAALQRLGELGQPGIDAFNELMATRSECPEFDAGIDLLDTWIGHDPAD